MNNKPEIVRLGTIDENIVESTPLVFKEKLWLFQYIRKEYHLNNTGDSYFRIISPEDGCCASQFGQGLHLGSAFQDGDKLYAFGVDKWGGQRIFMTESSDVGKWTEPALVFEDLEMGAHNTSVCKGRNGNYVMACEQDRPEDEVGIRFTIFFLESQDMRNWRRCAYAPPFSPEKYTACPALRFVEGKYYLFVLEGSYETYFAEHLYRSDDLRTWEGSPFNPCLMPHRMDRHVANDSLSEEQRQRISTALNINTSDIDLCEYMGQTEIFYSWGNQRGTEFLARARCKKTLAEFLKSWFPS